MAFLLATPIPTQSVALILLAGAIYTAGAATLQRKLVNPRKSRELQDQIRVYTKEIQEMVKRNAPKEEISAKQGQMMPLMKQSMTMNLKSTFILIPSFIVIYYLIIPHLFGSLGTDVVAFTIGSYNVSLQYRGLFFVVVFVLGLATSMGVLLYDRHRAKLDTLAKLAQEGIK